MNIQYKIEDLLSNNGSDFELSKIIRKEIKNSQNSFEEVFAKNQGKKFLLWHGKNVDQIIKIIYKYILRHSFKEFVPMINSIPITIIALGSYGREQLSPYSDIDLLIVYRDIDGYNTEPIIQRLIQILWDSGMKIGHRVHKLEELFEASQSDHTIKTALIESRFISGSKFLWVSVENELKRVRNDNQKLFITQKIEEYRQREAKSNFSMQPDIKSSLGGIRDFNTLFWITNSLFNLPRVKELLNNILSYNDYTSLYSSVEFLFKVRTALHISCGKKQDRLILEYAPTIGKMLQISETKLIKKTFSSMSKIRVITRETIKRLTSHMFYDSSTISKLKKSYLKNGIFLCEDRFITNLKAKKQNLSSLFSHMISHKNKDISYDISFIYKLSYSRKNDIFITKEFFERAYLFNTLFALYDAKLLTKLIPPFKKIIHLAQFDGYHEHPVDIHLLKSIKAYEDIDDSYINDIFKSLNQSQMRVLKFATLLHDCGKGRKQDHSILGASIARKYATTLKFDKNEVELIYILIRYHTALNMTATSEDIYSDKIVFNFVSKIETKEALKLLLLLTYADLKGVGKGKYTNFNSKLIKELYEISLEALEHKKMVSEASKRVKKERAFFKEGSFLALSKSQQKRVLAIDSNLIFFKYTPLQIVEISQWCFNLEDRYNYRLSNDKILMIEIIRKDDFSLGYFLGRIKNLDVTNMDIFKFFNGIKYFKIEFLEKLEEESDLLLIKEIIERSFKTDKKTKLLHNKIKEEEIKIECNHSRTYASMSINTKDQKGILATIMSVFDEFGVDIASAKIQTVKNRVKNLILIEKNGNFCKNKELIVSKIIKA
ncbi:MAG TPA: HD domain-containing protein [Campylobacterales bacterium]|nr:HD domain-containing protein [Campylobacterales bacterium]